MNQSNKALREKIEAITPCSCGMNLPIRGGVHYDDCPRYSIPNIIALVTNHIKGALPKEKSVIYLNTNTGKFEITTEKSDLWCHGYNQALKDVNQLFNELEQKETTEERK